MNNLLALARDLEQRSRAQQQSTGEMLRAAFSEHKKSVGAELNGSEGRINVAILDHDRRLPSVTSQRTEGMLRMISRTWLAIVLVFVLLVASNAGIPRWQRQQILGNYTGIREQKDTLEKLNARTWGARYQEDNRGRFLMLPEGMRADTNQTFGSGRKSDIRSAQEQSNMAELEKRLLSVLGQLQQGYSKRLDEWENASAEWRMISGLIQQESAALSERVTGLSRQVQSLSEQLRRLSQG